MTAGPPIEIEVSADVAGAEFLRHLADALDPPEQPPGARRLGQLDGGLLACLEAGMFYAPGLVAGALSILREQMEREPFEQLRAAVNAWLADEWLSYTIVPDGDGVLEPLRAPPLPTPPVQRLGK